MARVALDSNLLIYAELEPDTAKGRRSAELILRAAHDGVIPAQVLGEFVRFVQRRAPDALERAMQQVALYRAAFVTPPTTEAIISSAAETARDHGLQFWDAVICAASTAAGADALLTEDMQDGRTLGALRLINPFVAANAGKIEALFQ